MKYLLVVAVLFPNWAIAQHNEFLAAIDQLFHRADLSDKVFVNHQPRFQNHMFLEPRGRCCFVDWNLLLVSKYPEIQNDIDDGFKRRRSFMTPFKMTKTDTIFIISIRDNLIYNIRRYVVFEEIEIGKQTAKLVFHTTSPFSDDVGRDGFFRAVCSLKKKRGIWNVTGLEIRPFPCCDSLWPQDGKD